MARLSREERMAFYINIYNQLIVRARACLLLPTALPLLPLCAPPPSPAAGSASPRPPQVHALVLFGPANGTLNRLQWCARRTPCRASAGRPRACGS
jgi:hypothetical protein